MLSYLARFKNFTYKWIQNVIFFLAADYETLRALDTENNSSTPSMSEEEINALPVHKYKASSQQRLVGRFISMVYCLVWCLTLVSVTVDSIGV